MCARAFAEYAAPTQPSASLTFLRLTRIPASLTPPDTASSRGQRLPLPPCRPSTVDILTVLEFQSDLSCHPPQGTSSPPVTSRLQPHPTATGLSSARASVPQDNRLAESSRRTWGRVRLSLLTPASWPADTAPPGWRRYCIPSAGPTCVAGGGGWPDGRVPFTLIIFKYLFICVCARAQARACGGQRTTRCGSVDPPNCLMGLRMGPSGGFGRGIVSSRTAGATGAPLCQNRGRPRPK